MEQPIQRDVSYHLGYDKCVCLHFFLRTLAASHIQPIIQWELFQIWGVLSNLWIGGGCWFMVGGCQWFWLQSKGRLFGRAEVISGEGQSVCWWTGPFLNIYDKGYRAKMAMWQNGRQLVLQPDFEKSDKKFNRSQTISSASVATDHGGNERVVNVSKREGLISRRFQPNAYPICFNKVWTT